MFLNGIRVLKVRFLEICQIFIYTKCWKAQDAQHEEMIVYIIYSLLRFIKHEHKNKLFLKPKSKP